MAVVCISQGVQLGIAKLGVMEGLKARQLFTDVGQIAKRLGLEEQLVVDIVEPFHDGMAPEFFCGDAVDRHAQVQTEADKEAEDPRLAVRDTKGQLVVYLEVAPSHQGQLVVIAQLPPQNLLTPPL
jgi:hypothetical protein